MKLLLTPCDCNFKDMARVQRSKWMRIFTSMRYYHCGTCQQKVFAPQQLVELHGSPSALGKAVMWFKPSTVLRGASNQTREVTSAKNGAEQANLSSAVRKAAD